MTLLALFDLCAVALFAVTGALAASRKEMDIFGFFLLGTVTGIGGGTVRDVLLGQDSVVWIHDPTYVLVCVAASGVTYFTAHLVASRYTVILWLDALGLALFAVMGADKALSVGAHPVTAIVLGMITATFGGIIRDVLAGETSLLLKKEIYVTAAFIGAASFVALSLTLPQNRLALIVGFLLCFAIRGFALRFGWTLPGYKPRPGRDFS